eukprot:XP_011451891.1 PREDICTED: kynurenine/alpha-aminoadipate aminotransferase, mitochondrial-like isoform X1 [Crassostrea gigas]
MDYKRFLTVSSLKREDNYMRKVSEDFVNAAFVQENPSIITMAGGMPNPQTFPILEATLKLRDGKTIDMDAKNMKLALQYSGTKG